MCCFHDNELAGWFLPQISIYNRILRKAAKGGGENTSWCPHKSMHTLHKPVSKAEPKTGVPATASGPCGVGGQSLFSFFLLPRRISSPYNETKALQNQDLMPKVKGIRKDI